ncbi:MAG: ABC transporter ATP-binding protein [Acidimicrobiales bacterium]
MTEVAGIDRRGGEAILTFSDVGRVYGSPPSEVTALDGVSLHVRRGELLAVMGPSGSGKSTLLTIGGGLEAPTGGTVEFDGNHLWDLPPAELAALRRRSIGYVFQEFNLLSSLTAAENVSAPLELDGVGAKEARRRAIDGLERVGLADRASAFPDDLSGGERQRVAIARGLIGDRTLLLADEPTGALDSETGSEILDLLRLACTPDAAVVVVTHDADVAARADRIVRLRDGRLVADTAAAHAPTSAGATGPGGIGVAGARGQR